MSEALSADVSIATHEAYQNLAALMGALTNAEKALESMGEAVKSADGRIGGLTSALNTAETQFKATGSEADRVKMEELRAALEASKVGAAKLKTEFSGLEGQLKSVSTQSNKTSKDVVTGNNEIAGSADRAGKATEDVGEKGRHAGRELKSSTDIAKVSFEGLGGAIVGIGASLVSLRAAVEVMKELEAHTKQVIEAKIKLGEIKVGADEKIQQVIDNLGFLPGQAGQKRALGLVQAVQAGAPGTQADVAAEILAKAQATGYKVSDVSHPELDTKAPAFSIAVEVAKFAARQRLDADTAGKLFNMAQISGVKSKGDMEKMLSQMEMAFNEIAITNPREGMRAAIASSAGRMIQGVPLNQAMAGIAAASIAEPDTSKATTNVEQFSRVAVGMDPERRLALAKMAQSAGLISPESISQAAIQVTPELKGTDQSLEIENAIQAIRKDREEIVKNDRERVDAANDYQEQQRRRSVEMAEIAKDLANPKKRRQFTEIQERQNKAEEDWARYQREAQEKLSDSQQRDGDINQRIKSSEARISDMRAKDAKKLNDAALSRAYEMLPLSQKEKFLYDTTAGMGQQELGVFAIKVSQGDVAEQLIKQLGPAAREAYNRALVAGNNPDVKALRERNAAFGTNTLSQRTSAEVAAERDATAGMQPGQEFFNNTNTLAARDVEILRAKGEGSTGFVSGTYKALDKPFTSARTEEMLKARRGFIIAYNQWKKFIETSSPKVKAIYQDRIDELNGIILNFMPRLFGVEGYLGYNTDTIASAQNIISRIGALINEMQTKALDTQEKLGDTNWLGVPALQSDFGQGGLPEFGNDGNEGMTDLSNKPSASAAGGGSGVVPSQDGGGGTFAPLNAAGRGGPVATLGPTYNISVGTLVSQGADSLDLPGRLGVPDLS